MAKDDYYILVFKILVFLYHRKLKQGYKDDYYYYTFEI